MSLPQVAKAVSMAHVALDEVERLRSEVTRLTALVETLRGNQRTPGAVETCPLCDRMINGHEEDCDGVEYDDMATTTLKPCPIRRASQALTNAEIG